MKSQTNISTDRTTIEDTQLELICNWGADTKEVIWLQCEVLYGDRRGYGHQHRSGDETNL